MEIKEELDGLIEYKAKQNARIEQMESSLRNMELQLGQILESRQQCQENDEMHFDMSLNDEEAIIQQKEIEDILFSNKEEEKNSELLEEQLEEHKQSCHDYVEFLANEITYKDFDYLLSDVGESIVEEEEPNEQQLLI